jgi:spoIIIJ-associated protein
MLDINQKRQKIVEIAKDLLSKVGFEGEIKLIEPYNAGGMGAFSTLSVESESDLSMLIGKNGQNLTAFEHLIRLIATKQLSNPEDNEPTPTNFIVDINDYRKSRAGYLTDIARNVARRVIQTQRAEALLPMNAYERRLIHAELASFKEVQTESIGQEPRRRIVIKPQVEF